MSPNTNTVHVEHVTKHWMTNTTDKWILFPLTYKLSKTHSPLTLQVDDTSISTQTWLVMTCLKPGMKSLYHFLRMRANGHL